MDNNTILQNTRLYVYQHFHQEGSGHDWFHIQRVVSLAKKIAQSEGANLFIVELAALLHDIPDEKLILSEQDGYQNIMTFLKDQELGLELINQVIETIRSVSFKGGTNAPPKSLEGQVVQDADRLDAIGSVGIARCFTYSGAKGQIIYDPDHGPREQLTYEDYRKGSTTAINHFYEKLLKLKDLMQTETGKQLAQSRHAFMEQYLDQFFMEWKGQR